MSNNLIAISNSLPEYLRGGAMQYEDSGLAAGVAPRAPKLSVTTAKQWSITKDGSTMILPTPTIRAVLVASAENITKSWYAKGFVAGSKDAPDCYSNDGKVPAAGVKAAQCSNCAGCPKNAFGSHPVTGKGKACSDRKLVVLVWEGAPDELMTFNVPTMSMQSLRKLDTELRSANIPVQSVLCELSFDQGTMYPVVKISAVGFVDQTTAVNLRNKASSQEVADLLRETDHEQPADATPTSPVPQQTIAFGAQVGGQPEVFAPQASPVAPAAPVEQKRRRRTKAEMEAARAAENAAASGVVATPAPTVAAPHGTPQEAPQEAAAAPAGGLDIGSLLAKWKS